VNDAIAGRKLTEEEKDIVTTALIVETFLICTLAA
jgi:hypothetical protein